MCSAPLDGAAGEGERMTVDRLAGALAALRAEVARGAQPASVDLLDLRAVLAAYEALDRALWVAGDAAVEGLADERARCAAVCREVARFYAAGDVGSVVALACADEIERDIQTIAK
jgi:hypothetical protein